MTHKIVKMIKMRKKKIENELTQLKTTYIKRGYKQLLIRLLDYFLMQFMAIGYTYKLDLNKIEYVPPMEGLTFETMSILELDSIFRDYKDEINEKSYQDFLEKLNNQTYDGFIMKKEGELCGYCFINYGTTYPILKDNYVDEKYNGYLLTDRVFKKYQNQKIHQYAIYNRLQVLKEKNYKTATALVKKYNYPSRASIEKFGFKKCVICYFFKFGKRMRSKDYFKII